MAGNIQSSFVKRTRDAKMNAGIAAIATKLAKENNDILFKKSSMAKRMFMNSKMQILKKYGAQARMEYMKISHSNSYGEDKVK